jgi:hypothetical protein
LTLRRLHSALILRSLAISAFTRVFDALWQGVSKDEGGHILRDAPSALLRMRPIEC